MKQMLLIISIFILHHSFLSNASAAAPPAPVPQTGQTISYYARDDGALQPGVAWPVTRFSDHANGTVTDNLTGLIWTKDANLQLLGTNTWQLALDYVAAMNAGSAANFGYTDWRLPNKNELLSLIDFGHYYPPLPTGHPFTSVQLSAYYWSATSSAVYTTDAWCVFMAAGIATTCGKSGCTRCSNYYVWPVRSEQ